MEYGDKLCPSNKPPTIALASSSSLSKMVGQPPKLLETSARCIPTEDTELECFKSKTCAAMQKGVRDAFAYAGAVAVNDWLDLGASVLILWYGGVLVMNDRLSAGKLITFQLYWNQIQSAYQSIMSVLMSLTQAAGAAQRVLSLVNALLDIDRNTGTKASHLEGEIKLETLYICYQLQPKHLVMSGVDLTIEKGDVCALVGRSGGGKSTIIHLLMQYYDLSQEASQSLDPIVCQQLSCGYCCFIDSHVN